MWTECQDRDVWDAAIAEAGAHPLQSAWWGDARESVDGIEQRFFALRDSTGKWAGLARVEVRRVAPGFKVAWVPRGPSLRGAEAQRDGSRQLEVTLKRCGFSACLSTPYTPTPHLLPGGTSTIWVNLLRGKSAVWAALDPNWRYGVRRASRDGVAIRTTNSAADISRFFRACVALSEKKGFRLPGSEPLVQRLIATSQAAARVAGSLYLAELEGELAAGALIARSGSHLHYLWGVTDRRLARHCAGEALHWRIIEDGFDSGMERYDLEGVDPQRNAGVYVFKRRIGGEEVTFGPLQATGLTPAGKLAVALKQLAGGLE